MYPPSMFSSPEGVQPKLAIIFRGTGKRILEDEKKAWHPDVDVYFQQNAWADTTFSVEWSNRTLKPITKNEDCFALFCDNLTAQVSEDFKKSVSDINGICWYGLPKATDLWQPGRCWLRRTAKSLDHSKSSRHGLTLKKMLIDGMIVKRNLPAKKEESSLPTGLVRLTRNLPAHIMMTSERSCGKQLAVL